MTSLTPTRRLTCSPADGGSSPTTTSPADEPDTPTSPRHRRGDPRPPGEYKARLDRRPRRQRPTIPTRTPTLTARTNDPRHRLYQYAA